MANRHWKRFERSPLYKRAKLLVKRVTGRELWLRADERPRRMVPLGDWHVDPHDLGRSTVVYSLGVGDDISFDLGLIERFGCEVHAFDPTPSTVAWLARQSLPSNFHFHPWAIAAQDGVLTLYPRVKKDGTLSDVMYTHVAEEGAAGHGIEVPAFTLATAMRKLNHQHIDVLKMDIEGAEYDVLAGLSPPYPAQLLVEFHHRLPGVGIAKTAETIDRLRQAAYRIIAVSETGREVSFVRLAQAAGV